jgi:hypothetical protein
LFVLFLNYHQPEIQGYLNKQGNSLLKDWKRRYFVLQKSNLAYFKSKDDWDGRKSPLGVIDFKQVTDVRLSKVNEVSGLAAGDIGLAFQVTAGARSYFMVGPSRADAKAWLTYLMKSRKAFGPVDPTEVPSSPIVVPPAVITRSTNPLRQQRSSAGLTRVATPPVASSPVPDPVDPVVAPVAGTTPPPPPLGRLRAASLAIAASVSDDIVFVAPVVAAAPEAVIATAEPVVAAAPEVVVAAAPEAVVATAEPVAPVAVPAAEEETRRREDLDRRRQEREDRIRREVERRKLERLGLDPDGARRRSATEAARDAAMGTPGSAPDTPQTPVAASPLSPGAESLEGKIAAAVAQRSQRGSVSPAPAPVADPQPVVAAPVVAAPVVAPPPVVAAVRAEPTRPLPQSMAGWEYVTRTWRMQQEQQPAPQPAPQRPAEPEPVKPAEVPQARAMSPETSPLLLPQPPIDAPLPSPAVETEVTAPVVPEPVAAPAGVSPSVSAPTASVSSPSPPLATVEVVAPQRPHIETAAPAVSTPKAVAAAASPRTPLASMSGGLGEALRRMEAQTPPAELPVRARARPCAVVWFVSDAVVCAGCVGFAAAASHAHAHHAAVGRVGRGVRLLPDTRHPDRRQ